MDVNNWRSAARARARARFQAKWDEGTATAGPSAGLPPDLLTAGPSDRIAAGPSAGVTARPYAGVTAGPSDGIAAGTYAGGATGPIDSAAWRTQLPPGFRQMIINKMMGALQRCFPVNRQGGVEELYKISVSSEEQIFMSATSQQDYRLKVSSKMLTMQPNFGNPMTSIYIPMLQKRVTKQTAGRGHWGRVKGGCCRRGGGYRRAKPCCWTENVRVGDNEISCGLSSGAKFDGGSKLRSD
ncbi:hypothetical protein HAX54_003091 [Datura stramonium]|uniref:Mediator complex subunit 15 KIX domain-containing protein n=1 Tax=Datura stramonium TaxID=4076 RepID=A0ABS8RVJ7_DATST|nr:hypothetical protein [Datura stramonium]